MEEDQHQHQEQEQERKSEKTEPVRSRWTPKPEQILILESIFNSGMVNPPKDETVRIRQLLEKFGSVGDANVFYWFQNRRSRSRRRQRQMQAASLQQQQQPPTQQLQLDIGAIIPCGAINTNTLAAASSSNSSSFLTPMGFTDSSSLSYLAGSASASASGSSSSCGGGGGGGGQDAFDGFFPVSDPQMGGFPEIDQASVASSVFFPPFDQNFNYHPGGGMITVFINEIATEVPRGAIDMKTMFGEDVMLVHSSGIPLPINEFGFLMQSLQHGESYFLVSKQTNN